MNIGVAQFTATTDKSDNLDRVSALTAQARKSGAELVLFPECSMADVDPLESLVALGEPLDGPFVSALSALARLHDIVVVAGMFESSAVNGHVSNTIVALGPDGALIGAYRKIHLFDAFGYRESDYVCPGSGETVVFSVGDMVFGVQNCYDVRFPEITRHLVDRGATVILEPAAWAHGPLKESHWEILVRARAIENTVYVAAAGLVGGRKSGCSMVVDPMGVPIVRLGETEGVAVGEVTLDRISEVRRKLPSREHLRPDVYARWTPVFR